MKISDKTLAEHIGQRFAELGIKQLWIFGLRTDRLYLSAVFGEDDGPVWEVQLDAADVESGIADVFAAVRQARAAPLVEKPAAPARPAPVRRFPAHRAEGRSRPVTKPSAATRRNTDHADVTALAMAALEDLDEPGIAVGRVCAQLAATRAP